MLNLPLSILTPALTLLCGCSTLQAHHGDETLVDVYERVRTSVVTLHTISRTGKVSEEGLPTSQDGVGSGVLIDNDGRILTAAHVVQLAERVVVEFSDGARREAKILGTDPHADVGLIQITETLPATAKPAALGDSDGVRVGESVFVVGAPLGVTHTLTTGIISARRTSPLPFGTLHVLQHFQTDAPINPGNSGGPMFDMQGVVIGVVSHIISRTGGSQGLGFAVTSNFCRASLLEREPVWSGIDGVLLAGDAARLFQIPGGRAGFLIEHVAAGSLGEAVGLRGGKVPAMILEEKILLGGDIILDIGGVLIDDPLRDQKIRALKKAGGRIPIAVLRGGERMVLHLAPK